MVIGSSSPLISSSSNAAVPAINTVYFIKPAGCNAWGTTEAQYQHRVRNQDTKYSNLNVDIGSNAVPGTSIIISRNNGIDGNVTVSIPSSTTGIFEDLTNSDTLTNGNTFGWKYTPGAATGLISIRSVSCTQTPAAAASADECITRFMCTPVNATTINTSAASTTGYLTLEGEASASGTGTESAAEVTMRKAGTFSHLLSLIHI